MRAAALALLVACAPPPRPPVPDVMPGLEHLERRVYAHARAALASDVVQLAEADYLTARTPAERRAAWRNWMAARGRAAAATAEAMRR